MKTNPKIERAFRRVDRDKANENIELRLIAVEEAMHFCTENRSWLFPAFKLSFIAEESVDAM
jgi:hypothetical protein